MITYLWVPQKHLAAMDQTLPLEWVHPLSMAPLTVPPHKQLLYAPLQLVETHNNQACPGKPHSGAPNGATDSNPTPTRNHTHYQVQGPTSGHPQENPAKALPADSAAASSAPTPSCPSISYGRTTSAAADPITPTSETTPPSP